MSTPRRSPSLLKKLGIVGMQEIEAVVFAALATESPLLLIGPHGTAKSLLLLRLCEALGLTWRHYNASLLNYDDLVGYPLPDDNNQLHFVQTPASIWNAEAVFLDEISRCRPDMQNRLFSIVHEKRVQGLLLDNLVYRWAAMNPPPNEDFDESEGEVYIGSRALDPALADRFNFVVEVPCWSALAKRDKEAVIRAKPNGVDESNRRSLRTRIANVRNQIAVIEQALGDPIAEYVRLVSDHARHFQLQFSGRRTNMLYHNIIAVHAAASVRLATADPCDSAYAALLNSIPQRACGQSVDQRRLLIAHNESWQTARLDKLDPKRLILGETDPVRRAIKAVVFTNVGVQELSAFVADGLAELPNGGRHALASFIIASPGAGDLNAAVAEQVAELHSVTIVAQDAKQSVASGGSMHRAWDAIVSFLASLNPNDPEAPLVTNLLVALFAASSVIKPEDVATVVQSWNEVRALCEVEA